MGVFFCNFLFFKKPVNIFSNNFALSKSKNYFMLKITFIMMHCPLKCFDTFSFSNASFIIKMLDKTLNEAQICVQ